MKAVGLYKYLPVDNPESLYQTPDMRAQHDLLAEAARLIDEGTLRHTMRDSLGPLNAENLHKAHAALESGRMIGKLVLSGIP